MVESPIDPFRDLPPPEVQAVRPGEVLDWPAIESYLRKHMPRDVDLEGDFEVLQFPNGSANLTYMLRFGDTELVFRRPPFGTLAPGAHDMKREYRVLSRLWQTFDRAPRAYLFCDDVEVAGADFFVMERRKGEVIRGVIPPSMRHHKEVGRRIGFALIDAIAEFHLVDTHANGMDDMGKPAGFVDRQLAGWKKRWDLVADLQHDKHMQALHQRLVKHQPQSQRVSLVHNDLKMDNCMFDPANADRVIAFFDWDMTTLGDPLIDLGTLLNYWPDPKDSEAQRRGHDGMQHMGLPTREEVIARYGERTGLDVKYAKWYEAFGLWKTATVMQQLHYRWKVGDSTDERMATVNEAIPRLLQSTDETLQASGV